MGLVVGAGPAGPKVARTADAAARRALAAKGARFVTASLIACWHGNGTTNRRFAPVPEGFAGKETFRIGDCVAPRLAADAFHEGRKIARNLWQGLVKALRAFLAGARVNAAQRARSAR